MPFFRSTRTHAGIVTALLAIQAGLLAYSATRHSPTDLEPAFLASGISHWEFGRFESYRVNPPLVRMVAAIPVLAAGYKSDWSNFYEGPGARAEFPLGEAFLKANGRDAVPLFFYARWACIPFSLLGAYFAYRWARELYGARSGLVTLLLYVFEPNLMAHGELITPDAACVAFGILAGYTFWKWLKQPTWASAAVAGGALGLAELSKMSWLILFGLWPLLWVAWRLFERKSPLPLPNSPEKLSAKQRRHISSNQDVTTQSRAADAAAAEASPQSEETSTIRTVAPTRTAPPPFAQLMLILCLAVYAINLGYAFDGTGTQLKDFKFVSKALTGQEVSGTAGNRFQDMWLGQIPLPVPAQYVLGFDLQKKDFEKFHHRSYLRGEWRDHGWWYYYLYGLCVKVPCGIWAIFAIVVGSRFTGLFLSLKERGSLTGPAVGHTSYGDQSTHFRDELILLTPAVALLTLVSSQTEFSIHLRYAFPTLGLALIYLGQAGRYLTWSTPIRALAITASLLYAVTSSLLAYPNHLAYFNEFVGGSSQGHHHLMGSSLDWGQGTLEAVEWLNHHEPAAEVEFSMFSPTLATILRGTGDHSDKNKAATNNQPKLILYSAERYSDPKQNTSDADSARREHVLKKFPSGRILVRVEQPAPSN